MGDLNFRITRLCTTLLSGLIPSRLNTPKYTLLPKEAGVTWYDELMDDDALAPPRFAAASGGAADPDASTGDRSDSPVAGPASPDELESPVDWTPEQGFSDPANVVRVWSDPEGGLARIRFSFSWRSRLGERSLGEAVTIAFMFMNGYLHVNPSPSLDEGLPPVTREPTPERVAEIGRRLAAVTAELNRLDPAEFPGYREDWEPAMGTDFDDGVGVWLDRHGRPSEARFDDDWLRTARSRELAIGVMTGYRKALAVYRPPVRTLDRRGELRAELHRLLRELSGPPRRAVRPLADELILPRPAGMSGRPSAGSSLATAVFETRNGDRCD